MTSSHQEQQQQQHQQQQEALKNRHQIEELTTFGKDGIEIVNDNDNQIVDLHIKDRLGIVKETVSNNVLFPTKMTEGERYDNVNRHFYFKSGSGLAILHGADYTTIKDIQPESYLFVEKGTWHQIVNTSKNEDLEFTIIHPGKLDRKSIGIAPDGKANSNKKK